MDPFPIQQISDEANRHFENEPECRSWLANFLNVFSEYQIK